jgi:hypothetical protein
MRALAFLFFMLLMPTKIFAQDCGAHIESCCDVRSVGRTEIGSHSDGYKLGLEIWPGQLSDTAQLLTLRPDVLRLSIAPGWTKKRLPPDGNAVSAFVDSTFGAENTVVETQISKLKAALATLKAKLILVVWYPPPVDETSKQKFPEMEASDIEAYAQFYVDLVKEYRSRGLAPDMLELVNEPDGNWGMHVPAANLAALVTKIQDVAAHDGVRMPEMLVPGTSSIKSTLNYLSDDKVMTEMLRDGSSLAVHAWDERIGSDPIATMQKLHLLLVEKHVPTSVVVSEFSPSLLDATDRANHTAAFFSGGSTVSDDPRFGAKMLLQLLGLFSEDAKIVIVWEFADTSWGRGSYGLFNKDLAPRPGAIAFSLVKAQLNGITDIVADDRSPFVYYLYRGKELQSTMIANDNAYPISFPRAPILALKGKETSYRLTNNGGAPAASDCSVNGARFLTVGPGGVVIVNPR